MIFTTLFRTMKQRFSQVVTPPAAPPSWRIATDINATHRARTDVVSTHRLRSDINATWRVTVRSV